MDLKLFLRRNQIDSCFIFSLMNYNRVSFSLFVESSLTGFRILQQEIPSCSTFPTLQLTQSSKTQTISAREEILKTLISKKLLKKGLSHSAWETQTFAHLLQTTYPLASGLPIGFSNRFNQCLRTYPKESSGYLSKTFSDVLKLTYHDMFTQKIRKTSPKDFRGELSEWVIRLNGQDFHGGHLPDKADFFMYSCLEANWVFVKFLVKEFPLLENWKIKMNKCAEQEFIK